VGYRAALEEAEQLQTPAQQLVALLRELAFAYHEQGKHDEAESSHRRALAISETIPGAERWVGSELERLAYLLHLRGNDTEAEPHAKRAVAALEKNPVSGDDELACSLGLLGEIYAKQCRTSEAGPLFRRAAEIMQLRVRSTNDVEGFFHLGQWYLAQDRLPDAERICEKAVAFCKATKKLDHPDLAKALMFLAEVNSAKTG
jgi:tetratricopeptide (TPR) repeat protein